ncbi:MAG: 2-phospho-L-lactate transferase [Betaproteobacteria bacterium]|nr:2-phospho-L-lactate transferase [Betaproteobacteria bacterium]
MILALAGGVGGAKMAAGLHRLLGEGLTVAVNTGDDFEHLGLSISPDLDTVMYTLAGMNNPLTGWGIAGETWEFMGMLERLGGETWFRLGDRDLAVHVERTRRLAAGETLSAVTAALCTRLGILGTIAPMSDQPVRTMVESDRGELAFQDYFVRLKCEPVVRTLRFAGAAQAAPGAPFAAALADTSLAGIVICPSNPYLSVQPILEVPGVAAALRARRVPAIAISPIVGGRALKGPAAKIMRELGREISAREIARHYAGLIDGLVIDDADAALAPDIAGLGVQALVTGTVMENVATSIDLAERSLAFLQRLRR